jgi:DNA polymerase (family 10)
VDSLPFFPYVRSFRIDFSSIDVKNKQIAAIFEEIGTLLELSGENPFKCRAYHNAARTIASLPQDIEALVKSGEIANVRGIGKGLLEKITEILATGRSQYHDELKGSLPAGLLEMLRIQGLGPKRIKLLYDTLKIQSIEQLRDAAQMHKLADVEGFGKKMEENILKGIADLAKHTDKFLLSDAHEAAATVLDRLRALNGVMACDIAGSLRRRKEIIGDIDILVSANLSATGRIMHDFTMHADVLRVVGAGETKSTVVLEPGIQCDLRVIKQEEYPFALAYFTGSKEHNVAMRGLAKKYGWSLNEYGFSKLSAVETRGRAKRIVKCETEADVYKAVGLEYIPPELREHSGEIEAARNHTLPNLIEEGDLRGTFHCHTTYSDGRASLSEMAEAARHLGWEYLGIADHSRSAGYAGGLTEEKLKLQLRAIDELNNTYSDFRIFKGSEVDILWDGTLDWSDRVLARLDYVVVSVHSRFKMTEAQATRRIITAIKNKYVTMLGHPTGRLLLEREGYPVNLVDVINAAADYGKIIEINANPRRLDLDWRLCKYAKEKGVRICINPDAHSVLGLQDVHYGVGVARKGWLERSNVINTLPANDIVKLFRPYH